MLLLVVMEIKASADDIVLQKNTEAFLEDLVTPAEKKPETQGLVQYRIHQLILKENAKLYVTHPAQIEAEKVILKPKSAIVTLGNYLFLKTRIFRAVHFDRSASTLSLESRINLMGAIDTQHKASFHQGSEGKAAEILAEEPKNAFWDRNKDSMSGLDRGTHASCGKGCRCEAEVPREAEVPTPQPLYCSRTQSSDKDGKPGQSAGSLKLQVAYFQGGLFQAEGGNGGSGAAGTPGGKGGDGIIFQENLNTLLGGTRWGRGVPDQILVLLNGADGGDGDCGGHAGAGGNGGNLEIVCEKDGSVPEWTLLSFTAGGMAGQPGCLGLGGQAGEKGFITNQYRADGLVTDSVFGNAGQPGKPGYSGKSSSKGIDGLRSPVQKDIPFE